MVRKFYSNVRTNSASSSTLTTYVHEKGISLNSKTLAKILNIPYISNSQFPYASKDAPFYEEMGDLFGLVPWPSSWKAIPVKSIKFPERIRTLIIMSNLMPLIQHSTLSIDHAQLLYALLKNHNVDLALVIIEGIISISNANALNLALGYAGVISKVLIHFFVPQQPNKGVAIHPSAFDRKTLAKSAKKNSFASAPSPSASTTSDPRYLSSEQCS